MQILEKKYTWDKWSEKVPSNMLKMCRFRSSCTCAKYHTGHCSIATDKRGYPHINIFLISWRKHMLWVLIRSASPRRFWCVPQHMFSLRNKKDISSFQMKKMPYLLLCCSVFIHSEVSNDSVSRQWWHWSGCGCTGKIWAFAVHIFLETHFCMARPILS